MLGYKMWRESWLRFALGAAALLWLCALVVLLQQRVRAHADEPLSYALYIWRAVYKANVQDLFVLLVIVLGLGGMQQERAQSTAGFTLSLPVSRWKLTAARAAVGSAEVAVLALLPALLVPIMSPCVGETFPFLYAFQLGVLWAGGGMVIYALTFYFSSIMPGAYSPAIGTLAALAACSILAGLPALEGHPAFDLLGTMRGVPLPIATSGTSTAILSVPMPWLSLGLYALVALGLFWAAGRALAHRDF